MKIIAGGGGDEKSAYLPHKKFYDLIGEKKRVLYIPMALDPAKHPWHTCTNWLASCFDGMGEININTITELDGLTKEFLAQYDGIYIGGGNTFKLIHTLCATKFDDLLVEFTQNGGVIFGGSAGAIILGKSIKPAIDFDPNDYEVKKFAGLDLLNGYSVWPHYTPQNKEIDTKITQLAKKIKSNIFAISETSAIYFSDLGVENIGDNINVFTK